MNLLKNQSFYRIESCSLKSKVLKNDKNYIQDWTDIGKFR